MTSFKDTARSIKQIYNARVSTRKFELSKKPIVVFFPERELDPELLQEITLLKSVSST